MRKDTYNYAVNDINIQYLYNVNTYIQILWIQTLILSLTFISEML